MTRLEVDRARAEEAVTQLAIAYQKKIGVFTDVKELLENQLPSNVQRRSREHARFLFYLIFNDYGTRSSILYQKAKALYAADPALFSPTRVLNRFSGPGDPRLIASTGTKLGTRFPTETAKRWYLNSEKLCMAYEADPRAIFASSNDARKVFLRIREFRGFGPKIGALLLRTFIGCGFANLDHLEDVLMPVDVHDTRIAFWTGAVSIPGQAYGGGDYHRYVAQVQRVWSEACRARGLDWLEIDRALWILGSKTAPKMHSRGAMFPPRRSNPAEIIDFLVNMLEDD